MKAQKLIAEGESVRIAWKGCSDGVHTDVFETICAFLNSGGGTLLLGVQENGTVSGLSARAIPEIKKGLAKAVANPEIFRPASSLHVEEEILEGKRILVAEIPESPEVHALRGKVFVRRGTQNVYLQRRDELARIYARKQDTYSERKIYPFLRESDLQTELIGRVRTQICRFVEKHPWETLSDSAFLNEMNLAGVNYETGERGLRFLAALLLGKDSTIRNIFGNTEVYCEKKQDGRPVRMHLETNLLDTAEKMTEFLEDILGKEKARAFVSVMLTEREYTGAEPAYVSASQSKAEARFAGSMGSCGNPLLKKIFSKMGWYQAEFLDGLSWQQEDGMCILRAAVSLKQRKKETEKTDGQQTLPFVAEVYTSHGERLTPQERQKEILRMMEENDRVSVAAMVRNLQVTKRTVLRDIDKLKKQGQVIREGSEKSGKWLLCMTQGTEKQPEHDTLAGEIADPD